LAAATHGINNTSEKQMKFNRRKTIAAIGSIATGLLLAAAAPSYAAGSYPCDTLTIVSPYPPGGTTDILARLITPSLQKSLGITVIVDNRGGASSNIGTGFVARANPDGCTALLGNNTGVVINRNLYKLPQDPVKALAPVVAVASVPLVLYVNANVPAKNLDELVKLVKADPKKYSFASGGSGSPQHLAGELLKIQKNIDLLHVPYKGQGPAMTDVMAGHVPIAFETTTVLLPHIKSGKIRPLATTGEKRAVSLPDLPTMNSLGFKDFEIANWYGVFVPQDTPKELVNRLNAEIRKALASPEIAAKLNDMGSSKVDGTPAQFAAFIDKEIPRWEMLVKKSNARID
jgi:tripartite-type tricarboxylate transporter receptor subunit TctC